MHWLQGRSLERSRVKRNLELHNAWKSMLNLDIFIIYIYIYYSCLSHRQFGHDGCSLWKLWFFCVWFHCCFCDSQISSRRQTKSRIATCPLSHRTKGSDTSKGALAVAVQQSLQGVQKPCFDQWKSVLPHGTRMASHGIESTWDATRMMQGLVGWL